MPHQIFHQNSEYKSQGSFHVLDFYHQKDMLLDEDKNANFHNLLVGSKTGLDSILKFFQGIIRDEIMDNIEKDANYVIAQ